MNRLRLRGCWDEVAGLLYEGAQETPGDAVELAATLVEKTFFTGDGFEIAEEAVAQAERLTEGDNKLRGAAALERAYLAYLATLFEITDRGAEAKSALALADELLPVNSPKRGLLLFRRGIIQENVDHDSDAALATYRAAKAMAESAKDELLLSYIYRHLGSSALAAGDRGTAYDAFAESLRLRVSCGFVVGVAPALNSLALASDPDEAAQLNSEAARLVAAFGGIPVWLGELS